MKENTESFELTPATLADAGALVELVRRYCEFDHIPFDAARIRSNLEVLLNDGSVGRAWLARRDGQAAGYMIVVFWFDLEFGGRCALMTDLYLEPAHRRKGAGRRMLQHAEDFCRKAGISVLELQVQKENAAALAFYQACGFQTHERIPLSKQLLPQRQP